LIFAKPVKLGRLPISYSHVWRMSQKAAARAAIQRFGTHSLRHTSRSYFDACRRRSNLYGLGRWQSSKFRIVDDARTAINLKSRSDVYRQIERAAR
jgi:integrase